MTVVRLEVGVNKAYSLLGRGLKWSYRKYGFKGAVGFLAVVGVAYYLVRRRLNGLFADEASD